MARVSGVWLGFGRCLAGVWHLLLLEVWLVGLAGVWLGFAGVLMWFCRCFAWGWLGFAGVLLGVWLGLC